MGASISELLERSRRELLDLSTRNRLLSIPVASKSAKIIEIHDELSSQVFRHLVVEKKAFGFLPGIQRSGGKASESQGGSDVVDEEEGELPPPDEATDGAGSARRHADAKLQTRLTPEGLQRRLLTLYRDSLTMLEEQGINILYLALGHLKWFEADQADTPRFAPLILVPVQLSRRSASDRFTLQWTGDDIEENLSLCEKIKRDFGLELPELSGEEEPDVEAYFKAIRTKLSAAKTWEIVPNAMTLGFFSFAKFLMYRDLDPSNWPTPDLLLKQKHIAGLLQDRFLNGEGLLPDSTKLDELIPVARLDHVVDADSSQTLVIEQVRKGSDLVVQGPPGTGKSQSITNVIATAILDGKKVLFVAEKLAALEVVKRRLEREGLGSLCLELHSNKANKRAVIEEVGRTWKLGRPIGQGVEDTLQKLDQKRTHLNHHADELHRRHAPTGYTPFQVFGKLTALEGRGQPGTQRSFEGSEAWTPEVRSNNRQTIDELAGRIREIGLPHAHPWRGVRRETILQIDVEPLLQAIKAIQEKVRSLAAATAALAGALEQAPPQTFLEIERQRVIAEHLSVAPELDKQTLCHAVWNSGVESLAEIVAQGIAFSAISAELKDRVTEGIWNEDFSDVRQTVAAYGKSMLRLFNSKYRDAISRLRGFLRQDLPKGYQERVALLDRILEGQRLRRTLASSESLGKSAFGVLWKEDRSEWGKLGAILAWIRKQKEAGLDGQFRQICARTEQSTIAKLLATVAQEFLPTRDEVWKLFESLEIDCHYAFGVQEFDEVPLPQLTERFQQWLDAPEALSRWNQYFIRANAGKQAGMAAFIDSMEAGRISADEAGDCFERSYFNQLLRSMVKTTPSLAQFDGLVHDRAVEEFRNLDRQRLAVAKIRVLTSHFEKVPDINTGVGATGILKGEMERKRGHRTVRRLLKDAGSVVQAIKPVFMMSPLSVAQFLQPGAVEFDLLVVDEASQVQPVDALGAVARCKQIVVVGDSKQLPPTRFFMRMTSNDSVEDEEVEEAQLAQAQEVESILGLCKARGIPEKMLRWHYRSKHHSLIAVSNNEFYENQLFIVPSPFSTAANLGLKFRYVEGGVFDSGGTATNTMEAKAVGRAVMEHARTTPNLSLGVVAFSTK